jgi:hypothetical protein
MDGTWLYYALVQGQGDTRPSPIAKQFGKDWQNTHKIEWKMLPRIVAGNIRAQLSRQAVLQPHTNVDIVRTAVFTAMHAGTLDKTPRAEMIANFYQSNFDVHR